MTLTDEGAGWWLVASTGEQRIRANPIRASGPLARRPAARAGRVGDCIPAPSEGCPSRPGRWCPRWCTPSSNRPPPPRSGPGSGAARRTVHRCRQPLVDPAEDIPAFAPFPKSTGPDLAEQPGGASQHRDSPAHRRGRYLPDSGLQWCASSARWAPNRRRAGGLGRSLVEESMAGDSGTRSIGRHCPRSARDQELRHRGSRSDHHDVAGTSPFSCGPAFHGRADRARPIDDGDAAVELVATGTGPNDMSDKRSSAT